MIAIIGRLASAFFWTATAVLGRRAARAIGEISAFAWAPIFGLLFAATSACVAALDSSISSTSVLELVLAGTLNVAGLLTQFTAPVADGCR